MARPPRKLLAALCLFAAAPVFAQVPAASPLTRIGAAAAVAGRVLAVAPHASVGRVVGSGKPIFLNDHVTTDARGRLQVLLLDQTVFTLGPNSDMVLDEFVYDPDTNAGRLSATVEKGAFRFISGHIAHDGGANMKVRTPSGTMGIRGTIVMGQVSGQSTTLILAGPGAENNAGEAPGMIDVSNGAGSVTIDQPGYGTTLSGGLPPTPPAPMSQQLLQISEEVALPPSSQAGGGPGGGQQASNAGPVNPTSASGQDTASGATNSTIASDIQAADNGASNTTTVANQDNGTFALANGPAYWEQIFSSLTTGQDTYNLAGSYSCVGGGCDGLTGTASSSLIIDWGLRQVATEGPSLQLNSAGSFSGDTIFFGGTSFAGKTGQAANLDITSGFGSGSNGSITSATLSFQNAGGVVAKTAAIQFTYSGSSSESISGSVSGSR